MELNGAVVIVTGAASGLGAATARHFAAAGSRVVLLDRDVEGAARVAADVQGTPVTADITDEADLQAAVEAAARVGPIRAVVAVAGGAIRSARTVARDGTPHSLEDFRRTLELNAVGTFNTLRLAAASMAGNEPVDGERGVFVGTSSIAGYEGQIGQIAYAAAKAAIIGMTLVAARDLASVGIRVNAIAPGTMGTEAWDAAPEGLREKLEAVVPFPRRFGEPIEFARLAEHLVTNPYLNGEVVRLDGAIRFGPQ